MLDASIVAVLLVVVFLVAVAYLFYPAYVVAGGDYRRNLSQAKTVNIDGKGKAITTTTTQDAPPILSVIIPAYNEEERLTIMLQEAYDYLNKSGKGGGLCTALQSLSHATGTAPKAAVVQWVLVDDGSRDQTGKIFLKFAHKTLEQNSKRNPAVAMRWKLVTLHKNSGKGAAVQAGMLSSDGRYCLMVDADGATSFGLGLEALAASVKTDRTICLGSRALIQKDRSPPRRLLAAAFRMFLSLTLGQATAGSIRDTQCGFKLFPEAAARSIFTSMHLQRWAFDIEALYLAVHGRYDLEEVVVPWHEVDGSKLNTSALNLALVAISMLRDMLCVRLCYLLGIWKVSNVMCKEETKGLLRRH